MLGRIVGVVVVAVIALAVAPPSAPVGLSYVDSDSMTPTMEPHDGYLVVPADSVTEGDVVTFWSPRRGEYVTHRVVGRTDGGFLTQGDANAVTDQEAGHPPVPREAIAGRALSVGPTPVTVPEFGTLVELVRANRLVVLALAATLFVLSPGTNGRPGRPVVHSGDVVRPLLIVALLIGTAAPILGATDREVTYVATGGDSDAPRTLSIGESAVRGINVTSPASGITHGIVTVDGATVVDRTGENSTLSLSIPPPTDQGPYRVGVTVHRYPATLPRSAVVGLHGLHPLVAAGATTLAALLPIWLVYWLTIDGRTPVRPVRWRAVHRYWRDER